MNSKINTLQELRQTAGAYRAARVIQTAGKLRLFDHTQTLSSAQAVAESAGISQRGAQIILDALTALGLLEKEQDCYMNSPLAAVHLLSSAESMTLSSLDHSERIYRRWATLPDVVLKGKPARNSESDVMTDASANRVFINAMHAHGYRRGVQIAKVLDLENVRVAIDVGGGAGSYLVALIEKKADISGILVDHVLTLNTAKEIIDRYPASSKIIYREMDIFDGDAAFGSDADLVILSNILHIEGPKKNIQLLKRIRKTLAPTGRLVIQDFIMSASGVEPLDYALFSVNMLSATDRGGAWRDIDIRDWLDQAGFGEINVLQADTDSDVWEVFPV